MARVTRSLPFEIEQNHFWCALRTSTVPTEKHAAAKQMIKIINQNGWFDVFFFNSIFMNQNSFRHFAAY